jgi:Papain family cysteine protease
MMRRRTFLGGGAALVLPGLPGCGGGGSSGSGGSAGTTPAPADTPYALGLNQATSDILNSISTANQSTFDATLPSYKTTAAGLPAVVDMSDTAQLALAGWPRLLPTPGNQGAQGSCVAWGVGYASASTMAAIGSASTASTSANIASPADLYAKILRREPGNACGNGTYIRDAMDVMVEEGVLTLSNAPYSDRTCSGPSSAGQVFLDGYMKIAPTDRAAIKRALDGFRVLPFGMRIYGDFYNVGTGIYTGPASGTVDTGGHCMALVGYNETNNTYKALNSWGSFWGNAGFVTISVASFERLCTELYVPYVHSSTASSTLYDQKETSGANLIRALSGAVTSYVDPASSTNYSVQVAFKMNDFFRLTAYNIVVWRPSGSNFLPTIIADSQIRQTLRGAVFTATGVAASTMSTATICSLNIGGYDRNNVLTQTGFFFNLTRGR